MSLLHSHARVGFHQTNLGPCSFGSARTHTLSRTFVLGGASRCAPAPAPPKGCTSRSSTRRNSSQSFNNGSMAENFSENDEDYADASVVEALEVRSGPDGFVIKMRDGDVLKCVHNKSEGGKLPVYAAQPAIVLQLNDGSNLLLPIIVLELPSVMLLEAVRNVQISRPTVYQVMSKMMEVSGYRAKVVRVTKRVNEAYFARIYLVKDGDDSAPPVSLDVRPSDAINLAVRCKVPIQVCNFFPGVILFIIHLLLFFTQLADEFYVSICHCKYSRMLDHWFCWFFDMAFGNATFNNRIYDHFSCRSTRTWL